MMKTSSDGILDTIAAVEAQTRGDDEALRVVLASCDPVEVSAAVLKLLFELLDEGVREGAMCTCHFREWALEAVSRQ
jgi:hypothetical protein